MLDLYPSGSGYIGKLSVDSTQFVNNSDVQKHDTEVKTIVILDRSGSMGQYVERVIKHVLPRMFSKLGYRSSDQVTIIAFDDTALEQTSTIENLPYTNIYARGCTNMSPAIQKLIDVANKTNPSTPIRLLTISDGEISDTVDTMISASSAVSVFKNRVINSQAIRLFTSGCQPDTRALSSLLQLNTTNVSKLLDIQASLDYDEMSTKFSNLFIDDNLNKNGLSLSTVDKKNIFRCFPWDEPTSKISIVNQHQTIIEDTFWLSERPTGDYILVNDGQIQIPIKLHQGINSTTFEHVLKTKIDYLMNQLKVLKIVNTAESKEMIERILTYFKQMETSFVVDTSDNEMLQLIQDTSLNGRVKYLQAVAQRKQKSISMRMAQIANDDRVNKLNSAQQAEYLRNVDTTRLGKSLARRAEEGGLDFTAVARNEVREMRKHWNQGELKDIDDSLHKTSFYSQDTTLGGIRTLCELDDSMLESMEADDIIRLLNLVGVACTAPIGVYVDPMTYRVDQVHVGCYISMSDVLTAILASHGEQTLSVPGSASTSAKINNVIPLFDDERIHRFLRAHAPSLLEYTASIGMRRVIASIPMTHGYTVCAGLWSLVKELDTNKSELHVQTFINLAQTYKVAVGKYFEHLTPYINKIFYQPINNDDTCESDCEQIGATNKHVPSQKSVYICNNGITNVIRSLMDIVESPDFVPQENTLNDPHLEPLLRALYTFEVWQMVRKQYKNQENSPQLIQQLVYDFLNIDVEDVEKQTKLKPLFEQEPESTSGALKYYDQYVVKQETLDKYISSFWFVDYLTLLPGYLYCALSPKFNTLQERIDKIRSMPKMDPSFICDVLGVRFDLEKFKLFNIVQALTYTTKEMRVNEEKESMRIVDIGYDYAASEETVKKYVRAQFRHKYTQCVSKKAKEEKQILTIELVNRIVKSTTLEEAFTLFNQGIVRKHVSVQLRNANDDGYTLLKDDLLDLTIECPQRLQLLKWIVLGKRDDGEIVWNNGNVLFIPFLDEFDKIFKSLNAANEWQKISEEHKARGLYKYRASGEPNRHGHSNDLPSYWAFGYASVAEMFSKVSEEQKQDYLRKHVGCCGL